MGQKPSKPLPGAKLQVIGAGLPRTGTSSFSQALSILLNGPIYHGGTQIFGGRSTDITDFNDVWARTPIQSAADKQVILKKLKGVFDGYLATTDTPGGQFVPELMELYPDAKVICTVRDADAWASSMDKVASNALLVGLSFFLFPLPRARHFPRYVDLLQKGRWSELYVRPGDPSTHSRAIYDRHIEWLKSVVPEEKLVFFDVRDGWGPLCEVLGVEVPDVPFPRINDAKAMDEFAKRQIMRGLMAWAGIVGAFGLVSGVLYAMSCR